MRAVVQRAHSASVEVMGETVGSIDQGYLILLGIESADSMEDVEWLVQKIIHLRIFSDSNGKMNLSLLDVDGSILAVSQFTLHASYKKGHRPSFIKAAQPELAIPLYEAFVEQMSQQLGKPIQCGVFGARMDVHLVNDGPVTLLIDTKNKE